ncbi:hypothetical protein BT96DRAFT_812096 [Gymnopus androsaceus JB14]|uniref:Uncharacterized protein n=1 Tax=Gymnopus androsaceus JB14 TaxID=1447944 RepID=A0A6A4I6J0_9AGAR|nr:hypothetical protein BT96DRAFT_812096 [Gymnopus androsaceus JB14]
MTAHLNVSGLPSSSSSVAWPQVKPPPSHSSTPRLNHLGWIEYALPDTTVYYSHPTLRVITDVDLRSITKLDAVTAYLEHRRLHDGSGTPPGFELWLRQNDSTGSGAAHGKSTKKKRALGKMKEFVPVRYWVDHRKRIVTSDPIWDAQGDGSGRRHQTGKVSEDSLDMEYRYWAFMEDHPAHVSLPHNARNDAVDVLTWSWTDRLLPSQRDALPPFTQAECQELNNLLRSFGEPTAESGIQSVLQTRVVSRILMRVVQWRQTNFRPHKPLPQDIGIRPSPTKQRQSTFQRTFLDIMVAVIFLGVPYLFLPRINSSSLYHLDEESGLFNSRSAAPVILLGGCTCLVAAIVLSASVTFLSLPGLDVSRIAGLVAALLATFSMVSTLVAFFRYKSDMDCVASWVGDRVGGEGMMLHSKRVVVLSLPLALLVYSIISFVVGIVLYSFFGVSETPTNVLQRHFEEYTRWTVVGVLGGLTGILFTSLLLLRR